MSSNDPQYYLDADRVFRIAKSRRPACLSCAKPMSPRKSAAFGNSRKEAEAQLPPDAIISKVKEWPGVGSVTTIYYFTPTCDWGKHGYFCSDKCAIQYAIGAAKRDRFKTASGPHIPKEVSK